MLALGTDATQLVAPLWDVRALSIAPALASLPPGFTQLSSIIVAPQCLLRNSGKHVQYGACFETITQLLYHEHFLPSLNY
jgi:hypothetical protein